MLIVQSTFPVPCVIVMRCHPAADWGRVLPAVLFRSETCVFFHAVLFVAALTPRQAQGDLKGKRKQAADSPRCQDPLRSYNVP